MRMNNVAGLNNLVVFSGPTGSGKSELAQTMIEALDPSYLQSFKDNAPHMSTDPQLLFKSINRNLLPPTTWWLIDEPKDVGNTKFSDKVGQALREYTEQGFRYKVVNVAVCTVLFQKINNNLRGYSHYWVRMWGRYSPGCAVVKRMETRVKMKDTGPVEVPTPITIERVNWGRPSPELLYGDDTYHGYLWYKDDNFAFTDNYWNRYFEQHEAEMKERGYRGMSVA